eukprot:TRINITY_DN21813_c0_g1_i1.p1 TRINITY_DN21813_c0_g1~~TRINITY_DN21813_c0_g1_i1.p1  ORF type:complete len:137 (+),score=39.34 TRINITY_DN21813_c0_g1_i1:26-412(+)
MGQYFYPSRMSEDDFTSIDGHMFEQEPDKAGFNDMWVGVANATEETIMVETHTDSAVPEQTRGWSFEVGGGSIAGVGSLPVAKVTKNARDLVVKDLIGDKKPEELSKYIYKKFHLNSDSTNKNKLSSG